MANSFPNYLRLNNESVINILQNCIFVFDTNVLLNFYRYSEVTSNSLYEAILHYKNCIWLPHQVTIEFYNNRLLVIEEQIKNYDDPTKFLQKVKKLFENKKGHPFISESLLDEFNVVFDKIDKDFRKQKKNLSSLAFNDNIALKIINIFDNKVGKPYSSSELNQLYKLGKKRYRLFIPPGFKDIDKPEPKRYGDLLIWNQIIDKSILDNKAIIFVTDDQKEDWVSLYFNQSISPLPELLKEFRKLTNNEFYIFQTFDFIKQAYSDMKRTIKEETIEEIKNVATYFNEGHIIDSYNYYDIKFIIDISSEDTKNVDVFFEKIKNKGYYLNINNNQKQVSVVTLKVPFEDLVRRFYNLLLALISECNVKLIEFEPKEFII